MRFLLQVDSTSVGLVNAAIIVLVVIFLTLPTVFVLAEYLRNRRTRPSQPVTAPAVAPSVVVAAPIPVAAPAPVMVPVAVASAPEPDDARSLRMHDLLPGIENRDPSAVEHDFTREPLPRTIGYLAPGLRIDGDLVHGGHLQLAPRCLVVGAVEVSGSLALGDGVRIIGSVRVAGNLYVRPGAQIDGHADVGGHAFLARWSHVDDLTAGGAVELEEGATVHGGLQGREVSHVDRVHDPRMKPPIIRRRSGAAAQQVLPVGATKR